MSLIHDAIGFGLIIESVTGALTAGDNVVDQYTFQHIRGNFGCGLLEMMHHDRVEDGGR